MNIYLVVYVMCLFFWYKDMQSTQWEKNSNVFTIYKESLPCENSTYKYDLHNKINM